MALFRNLRSLFAPNIAYYYGGGADVNVQIADMAAAALYRKQPNLRSVISILADNAAQVPLKVHDRASDNDRKRVTDSTAALLLQCPNPDMTPFEFKRWMYSDLLLYERFLTFILPSAETESGWELRPVPNSWIHGYKGDSPYAPESFIIGTGKGVEQEVPADKLILFHGYDPNDPMRQSSRVMSLKETLHEQVESNKFRRQMWHRGGRFNAYLTRPKDVQPWSDDAFKRFKETWKASWAGGEASEGGGMPILEDGMEIRTVQFNSRDAQWAESVKLSREDCAAVYHVNPALIWPGSGQTYASAKDNARALYNDTLAPLLMQATDRLNMDMLKRVGEPKSHYIAYDITIKTEGTFEEKLSALQSAVGAPFLSRNEARAKLDLPAIEGGDELIVPLNVVEGGLASPHDTDPSKERYNADPEPVNVKADDEHIERKTRGEATEDAGNAITAVYRAFFERQAKSVLPKLTAKSATWWNAERWNRELADELEPVVLEITKAAGERAIEELWPDDDEKAADGRSYDVDRTRKFVRSMCERRAEMVNQTTYDELAAIEDEEWDEESDALKSTPEGVFENARENRAVTAGLAFAAAAASWGALEGAKQNKRRGENVKKTWVVTSGNPRASHAKMNGETVQYDLTFSNGATWPGDVDHLDVSEVANCRCVLDITVD